MPHLPPIPCYTPGAARRTAHGQRETLLLYAPHRTRHQTPQEPPGAAHDRQTGNRPDPAGTPPQAHARPHSAARMPTPSNQPRRADQRRRAHPPDRQQHPDQPPTLDTAHAAEEHPQQARRTPAARMQGRTADAPTTPPGAPHGRTADPATVHQFSKKRIRPRIKPASRKKLKKCTHTP